MAVKLSSRQLAQLGYLETLPPRFGRIHAVIEEMAGLQADDVVVRGLARLLDQIKGEAGALSLTGLAETAGIMSTMTRRGGGLQMKVRGLRELLGQPQDQLRGGDARRPRRPSRARARRSVSSAARGRSPRGAEQAVDQRARSRARSWR